MLQKPSEVDFASPQLILFVNYKDIFGSQMYPIPSSKIINQGHQGLFATDRHIVP
jgi:hypothetical protein